MDWRAGSGGMRPLEDFYVHFGHFPTAVFDLFVVNNSDRGQWQGRQGNMLGGNLFSSFWYIKCLKVSNIYGI